MISELRVGPYSAADGAQVTQRASKDSTTVVMDAHARFQEAVSRGSVFVAANQAATTISVPATAATGLILSNPASSGKNLVLWEIGIIQTGTAAAAINSITLAMNNNPVAAAVVHTTALTIVSALIGNGTPAVAKVDSAATLPAIPTIIRAIWAPSVSATATTAIPPVVIDHIDGALMITPGCSVALAAAVSFVSVIAHIMWEEISI